MKTISIITFAVLSFALQTGFAGTADQLNNCCPATENTAAANKNQQLALDQIQRETEDMTAHHNTAVRKHVSVERKERSSLNQIQEETESFSMESLHQLGNIASQRVNNQASTSSK